MAEAILPAIRWTQLIAQAVHAVFAKQKYWWVIAVYAFLSALFELALDVFIDGRSVAASSMVIVLSTLLSVVTYFLLQGIWLYVLLFSVQRFHWGNYAQRLRQMMKPYILSSLLGFLGALPVFIVGVPLLFGMGIRSRADYLQAYPLMFFLVLMAVLYGFWLRLSFSYIGAMDDDVGALKTAWRRAKPYWWDMTIAVLILVIPNTIFKFWWASFAPAHFSTILRYTIHDCVEGCVVAIITAIQITAYRFAKTQNLKSGNENGAAA